jgi:hypothetical protein
VQFVAKEGVEMRVGKMDGREVGGTEVKRVWREGEVMGR